MASYTVDTAEAPLSSVFWLSKKKCRAEKSAHQHCMETAHWSSILQYQNSDALPQIVFFLAIHGLPALSVLPFVAIPQIVTFLVDCSRSSSLSFNSFGSGDPNDDEIVPV